MNDWHAKYRKYFSFKETLWTALRSRTLEVHRFVYIVLCAFWTLEKWSYNGNHIRWERKIQNFKQKFSVNFGCTIISNHENRKEHRKTGMEANAGSVLIFLLAKRFIVLVRCWMSSSIEVRMIYPEQLCTLHSLYINVYKRMFVLSFFHKLWSFACMRCQRNWFV